MTEHPIIPPVPAPVIRPISWQELDPIGRLRLVALPDRRLPWVSVRLVFRTGGARSDGDRPGLASFTAGMLSAGTTSRDAIAFARAVESLGADLGADAGSDTTAIDLGTLRRYLDDSFALLGEMLGSPAFSDEEIERERAQRRAALIASAAEPDYQAETALTRRIMRSTPYATPIDGELASIDRITADDVRRHHARLRPEDAFLVASGDIDGDDLRRLVSDHLARWIESEGDADRSTSTGAIDDANETDSGTTERTFIERPGSVHTAIRLGRRTVPRSHPDHVPLRVLTTILGDSFNSRLNQRLREDLGYTYGAWASLGGMLDAGMMMLGTSIRPDRQSATLAAIDEELLRLIDEPISTDEITMVHRYLAGRHAMSHESADDLSRLVESLLLYELPSDHHRSTLDRIASLTPSDLQSTAARYLPPSTFTTTTSGPRPSESP